MDLDSERESRNMRTTRVNAVALAFALASVATAAVATDGLPSWNDGKAKQSIMAFVKRVTTKGSKDFVPVQERIATFDNDGTLWAEQPSVRPHIPNRPPRYRPRPGESGWLDRRQHERRLENNFPA
jgi:hypothetical protein